MSRPWMPFYVADPFPEDGPSAIFGYDGKVYPERASVVQWRAHRLRRAREKGTHTQEQWEALRDRIGRCMACGRTDLPLTKDHIFPVSRGGCDCLENLQPLCRRCNSRKGTSS